MEPVKIIIFLDEETTSIHSETPLQIMQFSRGNYEIYPDDLIKIQNLDWQYDGILPDDGIDNFNEIWDAGTNFENNPERVKKIQELRKLEEKIQKQEKELTISKNKLKELQ